jgi:hypothetical protein
MVSALPQDLADLDRSLSSLRSVLRVGDYTLAVT